MSRFSGKCDFCDEIGFIGIERILNAKIFIGDSDVPLELNSLEDCIPYYPYVVTSANLHKIGGDTIRLTSKSWVDIHEERYGHSNIHDYYRNELKKEMERFNLPQNGEHIKERYEI